MSNYTSRLDRLENVILPSARPKYVRGIMHCDDHGNPANVELCGRSFSPLPGESEDDLCTRAMTDVASTDRLMLIQLVKSGPNGGLAPGFERFAKHA